MHVNVSYTYAYIEDFCLYLEEEDTYIYVFNFNFRFLGSEDKDNFFSRATRSRMVYEILCATPFGREKKGEVGVGRLLDEGAFHAAFPVHDVTSNI